MQSDAVDETLDSTAKKKRATPEERVLGRVVGAYPPELAVSIDLGAERTLLGRASEDPASPALYHPTVSRAHFAIEWDVYTRAHVGRDLGSRNGSSIDGVKTGPGWHPLSGGSVLRIGDVMLVYEPGHTLDEPDALDVSRTAIPGDALAIRKLRAKLSRAAPDLSPVLIIGETGTGKEQIAGEVHRRSGRKGQFVAVNCATLGEQLIESQLFGHVKGAFTGATTDQPGLFRAAEGGSLFLDEIGELPKDLQPKLLRAIQEREVMAVGSARPVRVDVRVVAATHQDLAEKARAGTFRQDLYARLALWELRVPALRERRADIPAWTDLLYRTWLAERGYTGREPLAFDADAAEALLIAPWTENLRGLNRFVHELATRRIVGRPVTSSDVPEWVYGAAR